MSEDVNLVLHLYITPVRTVVSVRTCYLRHHINTWLEQYNMKGYWL